MGFLALDTPSLFSYKPFIILNLQNAKSLIHFWMVGYHKIKFSIKLLIKQVIVIELYSEIHSSILSNSESSGIILYDGFN